MKVLTIGAGAYGLALSTILNDKNEVTVVIKYNNINIKFKILKFLLPTLNLSNAK